jgi:homocysteine S-methyltransferase
MFGFVGPNGAGKTTTMRIVLGVLEPDAGTVRWNGRAIDAATSFYTGVAVNPSADDIELELERYRRKIDAGADFAMTQIVFDLELFDEFFERFGGPSPIPVLVGVFPVWSYPLALRLHNEVPGIVVPQRIQEALRDAGPDGPKIGMELAHDLIEGSRSRADGVYLVAPFRRPLAVLELVEDAA